MRRRGDQPPTARPGARALWKTSGVPSAGPAERPRLRPAAQQPRAQLGDGAARPGLDAGRGDGPRILPCRSAPHGCGLRNVQQGRALGVGQLAARREPGSTRRVSSPGAQMTPVSAQGPVPEKPPPVLRAMPPHRRGARPTEDRGALAAGLATMFVAERPHAKREGEAGSPARRRRRSARREGQPPTARPEPHTDAPPAQGGNRCQGNRLLFCARCPHIGGEPARRRIEVPWPPGWLPCLCRTPPLAKREGEAGSPARRRRRSARREGQPPTARPEPHTNAPPHRERSPGQENRILSWARLAPA